MVKSNERNDRRGYAQERVKERLNRCGVQGDRTMIYLECPKCGKEYNIGEYEMLKKANPSSLFVGSVHGKKAPKEAIEEAVRRTHELGLDTVIHKEHVDVYRKDIYNPRTCSKCGAEFGFMRILPVEDADKKDCIRVVFNVDLIT